MSNVHDNTKFECNDCGTIVDFASGGSPLGNMRRCPNCGAMRWDQLQITLVCDFCATTQNVSWELPCADFHIPIGPGLPDQGFKNAWSACDECKTFIDNEDREGLVRRAILMDPDKAHPLTQRMIRAAHNGFFANRTGKPVHIPGGEHARS